MVCAGPWSERYAGLRVRERALTRLCALRVWPGCLVVDGSCSTHPVSALSWVVAGFVVLGGRAVAGSECTSSWRNDFRDSASVAALGALPVLGEWGGCKCD